jgi:hypothetical protein
LILDNNFIKIFYEKAYYSNNIIGDTIDRLMFFTNVLNRWDRVRRLFIRIKSPYLDNHFYNTFHQYTTCRIDIHIFGWSSWAIWSKVYYCICYDDLYSILLIYYLEFTFKNYGYGAASWFATDDPQINIIY